MTNLIDADALELVGSGNEVASVMALTKVAALAYLIVQSLHASVFCGSRSDELRDEERKMAVWRYLSPAWNRIYGSVPCISVGTHYHRISRNRICSWTDRCGDIRSDCVMENPQIRQRICGRIQLTCGFRR